MSPPAGTTTSADHSSRCNMLQNKTGLQDAMFMAVSHASHRSGQHRSSFSHAMAPSNCWCTSQKAGLLVLQGLGWVPTGVARHSVNPIAWSSIRRGIIQQYKPPLPHVEGFLVHMVKRSSLFVECRGRHQRGRDHAIQHVKNIAQNGSCCDCSGEGSDVVEDAKWCS
jgi:hypothetical protein